ncbi:uncharacterized protein [Physcomitrium patens]
MHYVKGLPFDNPELINEKFKTKARTLVGWELSARYPERLEAVLDECREDYHDAVNQGIQDYRLKINLHEGEKLAAMQIFPLQGLKAPCPRQGCAPTQCDPEQKFLAIRRLIHDTLIIAELAMLFALQLFHREYDISEQTLVNPILFTKPRPMSWSYFPPLQDGWCSDRSDDIKATWMGNVVGLVEEIIPPSDITDQQKSHVRRFAYRLHFTMTQHLRDVVLNSVDAWAKLWDAYTMGEVIEDEDADDFVMPDNDTPLEAEVEEPKPKPYFLVKLSVDKDCKFVFVPELEEIKEVILVMLDDITLSVAGIENLVSRLDSKIVEVNKTQEIHTVTKDHLRVVAARTKIQNSLDQNIAQAATLRADYDDFVEVATTNMEEYLAKYKALNCNIDDYEKEVERLNKLAADVMAASEDEVWLNMFVVDCKTIQEFVNVKASNLAKELLKQVLEAAWQRNTDICKKFQTIQDTLLKSLESAEEWFFLREYLDKNKQYNIMKDSINIPQQVRDLFERKAFLMPNIDFELYWATIAWPQQLQKDVDEAEKILVAGKTKYMGELVMNQMMLKKEVVDLETLVREFMDLGDLESWEERYIVCTELEAKLKDCHNKADLYGRREEIFGQISVEHPAIEKMEKDFENHISFWHTANDFLRVLPNWMDGPFTLIDGEEMLNNMDKWVRASAKCAKLLTKDVKIAAEELRKRIMDFNVNVPMIYALRNPGMRDRHWKRLTNLVGFEVVCTPDFSLRTAINLNLPKYLAQCEEVSEFASKEHALEKSLDKMQGDWATVKFEYTEWKATKTCILRGTDDLQQVLDDQLIKTQSMTASPYIGPFEDRVRIWFEKLQFFNKLLKEWLSCQVQWMYLEPIFTSEDIMSQMPTEGRRFKLVDGVWRKIMAKLAKNPDALTIGGDEDIMKQLQESNKDLDFVTSGLNEYLETKRLAFPRFYFLSNDELLEILAETKDPLRVQPFLKKIFEGIHSIEFEQNMVVKAMISEEGEKIYFTSPFNPKDAMGSVEKWLTQVEVQMRNSLKDVTRRAFEAYATSERVPWIVHWPGQVVLCISSMYWTLEMGAAIHADALQAYERKCTSQLQDIVNKVRGQLSKLERKTIGALIVIDVHARDVCKALAEQGVNDELDFDWISQLRYEYVGDDDIKVLMINAWLLYAFEYLGNSGRLVITPLTDRCYRTLMGALHLTLGGAPEGPAGTGKTETTKDLAKAIAMQCVVFNCSDGLDYLAMGKFFKGLASSGAWACFDEFNRIDLEVLSVIAQQILTIQRAKASNAVRFTFEGVVLTLKRSCNVFITMNPGYAGRSELPDNLKALFRSVAMMVPDYALISEITLYSFGYLDARSLARKLVATYRLCSEQLSSQNHYDYGMRAVISVLRAAGAVKQKFPEEDEGVLMLKSLKDVNAPKFLAHDVPLFEGILSDLFPGVVLPEPDYSDMTTAIRNNSLIRNIQPTAFFLQKIYQLYEMILVRHGLMLVGYSYGAKTEAYRILGMSLTDMHKQGLEEKTLFYVMNPKSIYIGQLYGQFDSVSHEWTDGVLARWFRHAAVDTSPDRKWIIFDGPVDAVWIENMNTVLDDNKKLCLMSGEIIQMTMQMNLIFEVQDLAVASPATVSRCGMVYVEPSSIGCWPLITSWMKHMKFFFPGLIAHFDMVYELLEWFVDPCVDFTKRHCKEICPTAPINQAQSLLKMYESLLDEFKIVPGTQASTTAETSLVTPPTGDDINMWVQALFSQALVWGVGGTVDTDGRKKFNVFVRRLQEGLTTEKELGFELTAGQVIKKPSFKWALPYPKIGSIYSYCFWKPEQTWKDWLLIVDNRPPAIDAGYNDIIVPTLDTARYSFLLILLVVHQKHVLFCGPTGTGKTVYIKNNLSSSLDKAFYRNIMLTFSAQTNANQTQAIIESKLDKLKKGIYGPYPEARCVVFVDDLNMPALETYGAQPPIEILRQWMDHGGWYDREDNSFRYLVNIQFVTAMGPPGGGRNPVTPRYMRHFNVLAILDFEDSTLSVVFTIIYEWWVRKSRLPHDVASMNAILVEASIDIYRTIQRELLPTPLKSHYLFNLRDLSKVFQGMCMFAGVMEGKKTLVKLWSHECLRVFHDRLVTEEDRLWFFKYLQSRVEKKLELSTEYVYDSMADDDTMTQVYKQLAFGDIMDPSAIPRKYEEIADHTKLLFMLHEGLNEFNAQTRSPMHLVLFTYAAQHILRISRIIRQPFGNALLVGVGGGGRQSLTRLATSMAGFNLFQVEITKLYGIMEWCEDLKLVLKKAGADNTPTVFLFNDTQLKLEQFLEDINNILNAGEVPNLYPKDEIMPLLDAVRNRAKKAGRDGSLAELYMYFVDQCRTNLHMVIAMSPFGDAFRTRLRMFPSLVNCCTIDWYSEWPEEALRSVATNFVSSLGIEEKFYVPVRDMCMMFHTRGTALSVAFLQEQGRYIYVTPTSYLELLATYKELLELKRKEVDRVRNRYSMGLEKVYFAEAQVTVMKQELEDLQPILLQTAHETNVLLVQIDADTKDAQATREVVEAEEAIASVKAGEAQAIKDDCEKELAVAMPMLNAALAALDTLTKNDITEVKSMKNPPAAVKLVMEACCIMKGVASRKIPDPSKPGAKMTDYWGPAQQMLAENNFLISLKEYDKDNMPDQLMGLIRPYISNPMFDPVIVRKASKAAYGLCCWIRAMESYHKVNKVVAPKKARLAAATAEFEELQAALAAKKTILKQVEEKLSQLQDQLSQKGKEKAGLEAEVNNCENKLTRAAQLINGLGGEKTRWTQVIKDLSVQYINLLGDVLLSSGYIAYLGAVSMAYREPILKDWDIALREREIPCSEEFSLSKILGDPVTIRDWVIAGLPNDSFSIDNAIIMSAARRWPLLIDPQGQANKWIRNKEKRNNLQTMKLGDGDFMRKLEACIQFGYPLLLENILEELDPALEPVLKKTIFRAGSSWQIQLGDSVIEYNQKFKFYMTTKLRNPHYFPEVAVKVTLLNFMITPEGLQDQLLAEAVKHERPELEEEKTQLVLQGAENAKQLKETEDRIIEVLSSAEGNILEDETAINIISSSKVLSTEIEEKQKISVVTEAKIDQARLGYVPVAIHVSALFFTVSSLANIDPMYQYSLSWYLILFNSAMVKSEKSKDLQKRIAILNDFFQYMLYCNVARSLFEKDKMLLSLLICTTNMRREGHFDEQEWRFFLAGPSSTSKVPEPNTSKWLSDKLWNEMVKLSKFPAFSGLSDSFSTNLQGWQVFYNSQDPYSETMPENWPTKLSSFRRLLVIRVIRPDKLIGAISSFLLEAMGQRYIEPPGFNIAGAFGDSGPLIPLIFMLSAGSDPMSALLKYAEEDRHEVVTISLGQGQGPKAAELISSGIRNGDWVVLQNCHLAPSWMPSLEKICEDLTVETTNVGFRLWLTSYPSNQFPVAILQSGVKMTNESPKGLRANMIQSYSSYPVNDPIYFNEIQGDKGPVWRKMLFGLCFFHAAVQERVKFGPLGWNIPYQFSDPDLKISMRQLQSFLVEWPDNVPWKALNYVTGECNYGGRVTDGHDRRTLLSILAVIYHPEILEHEYRLSPSGIYYVPEDCEWQDYVDHIKKFPLIATPEVLGLHENADITKDQQEVDLLLSSIRSTQAQSKTGEGRSRERIIMDIVVDQRNRLPPSFDLELARFKYPVRYDESMNSVLVQEMVRFNKLTDVIRSSLGTLLKALQGLVVMSSAIETLSNNFFDLKMPVLWAPSSYPTMMPLGSYFNDLVARLNMLQTWMDNGPPAQFWISGFFFTHAFLTGVLQNYARKYRIPIDTVCFEFNTLKQVGDYSERPEDGCYIYGMFMHGARWDDDESSVMESYEKILFSDAPMLWLLPTTMAKKRRQRCYMCPLYRTSERRGVLATTGHSSNFVFNVELPTIEDPDHWVRRGVAMLLSLND